MLSVIATNLAFRQGADASVALYVALGLGAAMALFLIAKRSRKVSGKAKDGAVQTPQTRPPTQADDAAATLKDGLQRTRNEGFIARLGKLFSGEISANILEAVEEVLLTSDIGVRTTDRLMTCLKETLSTKELTDVDAVWQVLRDETTRILLSAQANDKATQPTSGQPRITMVLGVNGTGKTTSIGKLAHRLRNDNRRVTLVAGDTFRAAAAEQLEIWGRRVGAPVIRGAEGADPSSVVFDGVREALASSAEHVFVDTAGRLHTQVNLMEELRKVRRVMGKAVEGAPHEVLMVLDATTGQNAIQQARMFNDATDVTGIILTKLDGTAKGGIVIGIGDELGLPIKYVGVGERVNDLRDFDAEQFVDALFAADPKSAA